jgi:hypothetical protein
MNCSLSNFEGTFGSDEFMARTRELSPLFQSKTKKEAVLGIKGLKKILLHAYNAFSKSKLLQFNTKEEALDYLVQK